MTEERNRNHPDHDEHRKMLCSYVRLQDLQLLKTLLPTVPTKELNQIIKRVPHPKYKTSVPTANPFTVEFKGAEPMWDQILSAPSPEYNEKTEVIAPAIERIKDWIQGSKHWI